ncbi:ABC transporter substrate-binding protein [Halomarina halobia]|uniref:ABC transporter substrate-binding protein n=1 Tax=Halomarina halobia TaxID=3033386 RepID=A0ABD6A6W6_9EURY|nr:ABC transporter substrate-binding protein [Halomarina sp. PSR21]
MARDDVAGRLSRRTVLKGTAAAGVAGLAGCLGGGGGSGGGNGSGGGSGGSFDVLHGWTGGDGKDAAEALLGGFREAHPDVEITFEPIGGGGNENLNTVVAKRLGNQNPPGAFAGWPGKNLIQYEGVLGDLSDVWEGSLADAHVEEAVSACTFNDKKAAMPIGSHRLNNLFYNVEVVEEAGVDPASLKSPRDLIEAMDAVAQNTDAVPMAHGMKAAWTTLQLWAVVMLGKEGYQPYMDYIRGEGDEAAVRSAFETTKEILANYINEDASSIGFTTANQMIMEGKAAFIHQGNWVAGAYRGNDLTYGEDWGWVPFPGTEDMYTLHIDSFIYPGNNPSPEGVKTFMEYVGGAEAQVAFNSRKGSIPTRTDVDTEQFDPYLTETIEDFGSVSNKPPTLAHGLAVAPETLTNLKDVISSEFTGPYNVDAATQGMLEKVAE